MDQLPMSDDDIHKSIITRQRRMIDTVENLLLDNDKRISLGLPRTYLENYRADRFRDLLDYQLETFRRQ